MLKMRSGSPALAFIGALAASLALAAPALAEGSGATVTVRVEGLTETKLSPKAVTTTTAPVVNDGNPEHACSGTSAQGALQLATGGDWSGSWSSTYSEYFLNSIEGEALPPYEEGVRGYYWAFWLNDAYSETGACGVQVQTGDRLLFVPECDEDCPAGPAPTPLEIEAPASADVGEAVNVVVRQYSAAGAASPADQAKIAWPGGGAVTDAQGDATLTFAKAEVAELTVAGAASGPPAIRTETAVCVQNTGESACAKPLALKVGGSGTTTAAGVGSNGGSTVRALAASLLGLAEGHVYGRRQAPRLLRGSVNAGGAAGEVRLRLTRRWRTRSGRVHCSFYSGITDAFKGMRCGAGHGHFFSAGSNSNFSYLLPAALAPGRYVLDLEATNGAGEHTKLARGSTRLVFYVR